jgi:hypothetical protein
VRRWHGCAGTDCGGKVETIHAGHLNVEEEQLWFGDAYEIDRLGSCHPFTNYVYFRFLSQELPELLTSEHFIIG